jgi:integrase
VRSSDRETELSADAEHARPRRAREPRSTRRTDDPRLDCPTVGGPGASVSVRARVPIHGVSTRTLSEDWRGRRPSSASVGVELAPTMTERSRRTVHLPSAAMAALREQRRRQLEERLRVARRWHDRGLVFASAVGTPLDARNVIRRYHAARERLGLPDVPWHHVRHFAATAYLEAGEDLFVVSRILGHTSVATTASFYGHVQPVMLRGSAERMDELMTRGTG